MGILSLQKLTVTNFRVVRGTVELDFNQPPGLYFVAGRNEAHPRLGANDAGKSTMFCESLSWLLQGRTSRSSRPGADVVNWHADGNTAGVTGVFVLDGVTHTIERFRNPSRLTLDGRTVEQCDIDQLLPLSDSALRRTLLIDQFGNMFMGLKPEEKSRIFSETLNLDAWINAADAASKKALNAERAVTRLEQAVEVNTATLAEVRDQREEAVKREEAFEEDRTANVARLKKAYNRAVTAYDQSKVTLDAARAKSAKFGDGSDIRELNDYKSTERDLIRTIANSDVTITRSAAHLERLQEDLAQYRAAKGVCPECGQEVSDEHIAEKAAATRREIKTVRALLADETKDAEDFRGQLEAIQVTIEQFEKAAAGQQQALSQVSVAAGQSINDTREMHRAKKELTEALDEKNPFTEQGDKLDARVEELQAARKQARLELKVARAQKEIYGFWQTAFREIRLDQIDTTLMELELAANRHGDELGLDGWEIQFATERETQSGTVSHKFTVFLFPPGQDKPVAWENYAGGVSQRWQLASTWGLSEILLARAGIDTDFEILDEPTVHLSSEGIEDMIECLKTRAHELNRRIYLIDHHALPLGNFDGIITVVRSPEGVRLE